MRVEEREAFGIASGLLKIISIPKVTLIVSLAPDIQNDVCALKVGSRCSSALMTGIGAPNSAHKDRGVRCHVIEDSDGRLRLVARSRAGKDMLVSMIQRRNAVKAKRT